MSEPLDLTPYRLPLPVIERELDYESYLATSIAILQTLWPTYDVDSLETDPLKIGLETGAYDKMLVVQEINEAARATLVLRAAGSDLTLRGEDVDVPRLEGELDEPYRQRIIARIKGSSSAGTPYWYRYHALSASTRIRDVAVAGDFTGWVDVWVLATDNGGVADEALLEAVEAAVNTDAVRAISDRIRVQAAVVNEVDVVAHVWLTPEAPQEVFDTLEARLRTAHAQAAVLGWHLTRAWIIAELMVPGVQNVVLTSPAVDQVVDTDRAIALGDVTLVYEGRAGVALGYDGGGA